MGEHAGWEFEEGDEIWPGRHAVRLLGGGRRYEAYLAFDDDLHALVTVKIVRPDRVDHPGSLRGLAGEAAALDALAHPSLVRGFDAVLDGERPHLVLEFLEGPRLSSLIRRDPVSVEQALSLALQLCSVVHYLGRSGWLHLDIKPRNVIMAGPPRLIDLSVARTIEEARRTPGPIGTAAYMAPEQCDPDRCGDVGPHSDVWGLGVTVLETLGRRHPFPPGDCAGDGLADRYPQMTLDPLPLPGDTPAELAGAIRACIERRPEDRPTALELSDALEPLVDALPRPRLGLFRPGGRRRFERLG